MKLPFQVVKKMSLNSFSHAYGESNYHIVFVPKYRKPIFSNKHVARGCKLVFEEISEKYGYEILTLEIMDDHVHLFLKLKPTHTLSKTFQLFKGISSRKLFWRFPILKNNYGEVIFGLKVNFSEVLGKSLRIEWNSTSVRAKLEVDSPKVLKNHWITLQADFLC